MKHISILLLIVSIAVVIGCTTEQPSTTVPTQNTPKAPSDPPAQVQEVPTVEPEQVAQETDVLAEPEPAAVSDPSADKELMQDQPLWLSAYFEDVQTGQSFAIGGRDKPVIVESFAVWCPTCTKQQRTIKELHEEVGDDVISIALNTDPNEDKAKVLAHVQKNGFDWNYAISPVDVTKSLIEEFGNGVVNAPAAPVIVVCPDQTATLLGRGVKSVEDLKAATECSA